MSNRGGYNPVYELNFDFFNNKVQDFWYFLGLTAADGYINDKKIEIALNEKDINILTKLKNIIQPDKDLYYRDSTNSYNLTIHNEKISKKIKDMLGMVSNNKHKELRFPEVPKEYINEFVRGYFDGDGTLGPTKGQRIIDGETRYYPGIRVRVLGNEQFLSEMNERFRNVYSHRTNAIRKKTGANVKTITYNFSTAEAYLNWIYNTDSGLYLKRKFNKYNNLKAKLS